MYSSFAEQQLSRLVTMPFLFMEVSSTSGQVSILGSHGWHNAGTKPMVDEGTMS